MNREEFVHEYNRLQGIFDKMRKLDSCDTAYLEDWYAVVKEFSAKEFHTAVSLWIKQEKFKPVPFDMLKYCWIAKQELRNGTRRDQVRQGIVCPWCGNTGWVCQEEAERSPGVFSDVMFPCECSFSRNPEKGRKAIVRANSAAGWFFDPRVHAFRRRKYWVGDPVPEAPASPEEQEAFWVSARGALGM